MPSAFAAMSGRLCALAANTALFSNVVPPMDAWNRAHRARSPTAATSARRSPYVNWLLNQNLT